MMKMARAQGGAEFLIMLFVVLTLFLMSVFIYIQNISDAEAARSGVEANAACVRASSAIASLAALGNGANYTLNLPVQINLKNYTARVLSNASRVQIDYSVGGRDAGIGCVFPAVNISNSTGNAFFVLQRNSTLRNVGGAIVVD